MPAASHSKCHVRVQSFDRSKVQTQIPTSPRKKREARPCPDGLTANMPRIFSFPRLVLYNIFKTSLTLHFSSQTLTMAATRLLQTSKPLRLVIPSSSSSPDSLSSSTSALRCLGKAGRSGEKILCGDGERKSMVAVKASVAASESVITSEPQINGVIDLASLSMIVSHALLKVFRPAVERMFWKLQVQLFVERVIINCRFFTLFAVAGSLVGSILCFLEGCFTILESYFQYFHALSQRSDEGHVVQLLIEAIDLFLVGTAMLIFGMGLYVMFVGAKNIKEKGPWLPGSNFFGLFYLRALPAWIEIESVSKAKSKIGHAVTLLLQVGVLEKFMSIPLVTGLDLACFAAAVLVSSACIFLLSRLSIRRR